MNRMNQLPRIGRARGAGRDESDQWAFPCCCCSASASGRVSLLPADAMASSEQTSFKRAVTSSYANAMTEKLQKERAWTERWKTEDVVDWRPRAISREGHTGVVMDARPYSPRVRTQVDFDQTARATAGYRRPKLIDSLPSGSTQFVVQPPATPRQSWTLRSWTPVRSGTGLGALPTLSSSSRHTAASKEEPDADAALPVEKIHAHLAQLAKLFSHPALGAEARHEFAELRKMLPRSGTQSGRDSLDTAAAVERMKFLPLPPTATTASNHYQPPSDFGRIVTDVDRSRFYLKDKPVMYRENTLRTTGKILNCTFSNKYPENQKDFIGKSAFPNWRPTPTKPQELKLSEGRGAKGAGLAGAVRSK